MNEIDSLRNLTDAVEKAGVDIAPTYSEYVRLALAIATDLGEAGREYFIRLCSLSSKFQMQQAQRQYSNALICHKGDIHLGTVFHLAELAGVKVEPTAHLNKEKNAKVQSVHGTHSFTHTHAIYKEENIQEETNKDNTSEETVWGSEPNVTLPYFDKLSLPKFLQRIVSYAKTPPQRDVLLLGTLTALGATMGRNVRCYYSSRSLSPNLQTFVVAPPASGKGILAFVRKLVEPIHQEIRAKVEQNYKEYKIAKAAYDSLGKERVNTEVPQPPAEKMFIIPGNNTGTGILQNLIDSGGTGIIKEDEADVISTALGSEHGHWSDTLRKAFDHVGLSYNRRTDREYREVDSTYLSVLISGTPGQVKPLIPSSENGLFSRQIFYYMPGIKNWENQFDKNEEDLNAVFLKIGHEWKKMVDRLKAGGTYTLRFTDNQQKEFNEKFEELFAHSVHINSNEMNSSVARQAMNCCRLMSIAGIIRTMEDGWNFIPDKGTHPDNVKDGIVSLWDFSVTDDDFHSILSMMQPLYHHASHILSFLPTTEVTRRNNADKETLFNSLGETFTRKELLENAKKMHLNENTVTSWLKRLIEKGYYIPCKEVGTYTRTRVCVKE